MAKSIFERFTSEELDKLTTDDLNSLSDIQSKLDGNGNGNNFVKDRIEQLNRQSAEDLQFQKELEKQFV